MGREERRPLRAPVRRQPAAGRAAAQRALPRQHAHARAVDGGRGAVPERVALRSLHRHGRYALLLTKETGGKETDADTPSATTALQSVTYTARTSCLGPSSFQAILRATDRWQQLWGAGPPPPPNGSDGVHKHAFLRHAGETCWLVRAVVKVAQSGDASSGYMQSPSADDFSDLHDFIRQYGHL